MREMRDSIESLRHEVSNQEAEMGMFEERVNNQQSTLGALRQQLIDAAQVNKEGIKSHTNSLEMKIASLESANKGVFSDLVHLKTHLNETMASFDRYKQKIQEFEKMIALQNQNIDHLQAAMRSLMEVIQGKETPSLASGTKTYQIKPGDTLEKIARQHHTTIKAIKELNHLSSDKIVVGQLLEIP